MKIKKVLSLILLVFLLMIAAGAAQAASADFRFISPSEVSLTDWMSRIPDEALITEINMPGTHDSGTAHMNWAISDTMASCQEWSITEQLEHGMRVFDIRVAIDEDQPNYWTCMEITHASFRCARDSSPLSLVLTLSNVLTEFTDFLKKHGDETIILCLSADDLKPETRPLIAQVRKKFRYTNHDTVYGVPFEYYLAGDPIPHMTKQEARGKIIVIDDESAGDMSDGLQGARFSYEMHYDEDTFAKRVALQASVATYVPVVFLVARKVYRDDVISLKQGFMNDYFACAERTRQEYVKGHGTNGGVFVNEGYENKPGKYGEPGLKYSGTNLNTAGNYLGPLSPTIRAYDSIINDWLDGHAWVNGARYGWITMDHPIDSLTRKIIATNEVKTAWVKVDVEWEDKLHHSDLEVGDQFQVGGELFTRSDSIVKMPFDTAAKLESGELSLEIGPKSPLWERHKPVTVDYVHVGENHWKCVIYPVVRVVLHWDHTEPAEVSTLLDGFFTAQYGSTGEQTIITADKMQVLKNDRDETVIYFNLLPNDSRRGNLVLDINKNCVGKAYKFNHDKDRVKHTDTQWVFTLHINAEQVDFGGTITFDDDSNRYGVRRDWTTVSLIATGHVPGQASTPDDPVVFREYQHLTIDPTAPSVDWHIPNLPLQSVNPDGSVQYDLTWKMTCANSAGYIVSYDYARMKEHRIDSLWTIHPCSNVEIRWQGDEADPSARPDDLLLTVFQKSTGKFIGNQIIAAKDSWHAAVLKNIGEDWGISLLNVPVYYKADGPFMMDDGNKGLYFVCTRQPIEAIRFKAHWLHGVTSSVSHPKTAVSLYNGEKKAAEDWILPSATYIEEQGFFGNLATVDSEGKPIAYTIRVDDPPTNYTAIVQGDDVFFVRQTSISGKVTWKDAAGNAISQPEWLSGYPELTLWRRVNKDESEYEPVDAVPVWNAEKTHYSFENLPLGVVGESKPTRYVYQVRVNYREMPGVYFCLCPCEWRERDTRGNLYGKYIEDLDFKMLPVIAHIPFTIQAEDNGFHPENEFTIKLTDADGNLAASEKCSIGRNVGSVSSVMDVQLEPMNPGTYTLSMEPVVEDSRWESDPATKTVTFNVRFDQDTGTVEAVPVDGCDPVFLVRYTHTFVPITVEVKFPVIVRNESALPQAPAQSFLFTPYVNGTKGDVLTKQDGDTIILSAEVSQPGEVEFVVEQIPANSMLWTFDEISHSIKVKISKDMDGLLLPDYVDGHESAFENTYLGEEVLVSGLVIWDNDTEDTSHRPDTVTLELTEYYSPETLKERGISASDIPVLDTLTLPVTTAPSQMFAFSPRRRINAQGGLQFYSVRQKPIAYYETTDHVEGYSVRNTRTQLPTENYSITVQVRWMDKEPNGKDGPDRTTVHLFGDNGTEYTAEISRANGWQFTFENVPLYSDEHLQNLIGYTLTADAVDGYTTDISGDAKSGFIVTYKIIPAIPQTGDSMNLPLVIGIMMISLSMLSVMLYRRKREQR